MCLYASKQTYIAMSSMKISVFVHINRGSFFEEQGAYKYWTLEQGLQWSGGDTFDDFC